ncbi:hypothetical protein SLEP1_g15897 [Rubroshorea leprosula]|uniref:Uncharacterized protein n=1 Tax=Rubroshorea leprosula TaxID=152421 RepID=A0AAV5IZN7_9ROSI|nr:hypothetical protein SLEP1_g15897 [Rubroshorea leprosula]
MAKTKERYRMHISWMVGLCFLLIGNGIQRSPGNDRSAGPSLEQPYRTAFHFQPPKNWMGDPNGLMYHNGIYHLFYQYNPYSPTGSFFNMTWGHSVSYDLVNWIHLEPALNTDKPYDAKGCWSGSTTLLSEENPVILYTGVDNEGIQTQNLAWPKNLSDPFLREWVKSPQNPLMSPIDDIDPEYFRDPTTAWKGPDGKWRVLVGNQMNGHGQAFLYTSEDFVRWTRSKNPFYSSNNTLMWECPDFYPVSINSKYGVDTSSQEKFTRHVLKASINLIFHDYYILGNYSAETDHFSVDTDFKGDASDLRYDYGKFYASKTFFDSPKKRRVLWGWVNESDTVSGDIKKGWSGLQAIPRSILLSENQKQLIQWPIKEIEKLRKKKVSFTDKELKGGSVLRVPDITASQADVEVSFDLRSLTEAELMDTSWNDPQLLCSQNTASVRGKVGPFGLLVSASMGLKEQTAVFFRVFRSSHGKHVVLMCTDQSRSSLRKVLDKTTYGAFMDVDPIHEKISLRTLIDHSIIESFGGEGRSCITARVYPELAIGDEAELYAFNNGTLDVYISSLNAWSMKKAHLVSAKEEASQQFD